MFKKSIIAACVGLVGGVAAGQQYQGQQYQAPVARNAEVQQQAPAVRIAQGEIFAVPQPAGWQISEGTNEAWSFAPDGSMIIGFCGVEGIGATTPAAFMQYMLANAYQCQNIQVLDGRRVPMEGGEMVEGIISYTRNGVQLKAWTRSIVTASGGYMLLAAAEVSRFDGVAGQLKSLAEQVQVTNPALVFQRQHRNAVLANRNLNQPMDHSFASAYWDRQGRQSAALDRGSDVRRDSYTSTDPTTGRAFYHGQGAYNPSRGGVVNPYRPTELLTPAPHWQGR